MKITVETDINAVAAAGALKELRRLETSFNAAAALRVERKEMTAQDAYGKVLPLRCALTIVEDVIAALDRAGEKASAHAALSASADSALCCLCGNAGMPHGSGYKCANPRCPRSAFVIGRAAFEGYPSAEPQKTPQDRAGRIPEENHTETRSEASERN